MQSPFHYEENIAICKAIDSLTSPQIFEATLFLPRRISDDHIPNNLAITLRILRLTAGLTSHTLPEVLNNTPGRAVSGRYGRPEAKFNNDTISNIENAVTLKIWQLGRYGNWCGIPPGMLLFLSQLASHLRDGTDEDIRLAKTLAQAAREICDYIIENADSLAGVDPRSLPEDAEGKTLLELLKKHTRQKEDEETQQHNARQALIVKEILDNYPEKAKHPYKEHARRRFLKTP